MNRREMMAGMVAAAAVTPPTSSMWHAIDPWGNLPREGVTTPVMAHDVKEALQKMLPSQPLAEISQFDQCPNVWYILGTNESRNGCEFSFLVIKG